MGLTEEFIEIELKVKCKYKYYGKELDFRNKENLSTNIKDDVLQSIFNTIESEIWCDVGEDLDVVEEDFELKINGE